MVSVKSGEFATNGWVELVHVDGIKGIQINELLTGGALPKGLSYIPVPISWVLVFFFIWSVVSIIFARTARQRGWKMLRGGIVILIVFVIIYIIVSKLTTFIPEDSPAALRSILDYIAAFPYGGRTTQTFGDYGTVSLQWGLQVGGYLLLISAFVQMVGGIAELRWKRTALRSAAPEPRRI